MAPGLAKKSSTGPRPFPRGNPRWASLAASGAAGAIPLGGTQSRVTKQKVPLTRAHHSDSLDSISDDEDNYRGPSKRRSYVRPNKNTNAYAEPRATPIPEPPHDPSKPAVMKHPDLPSTLITYRAKAGSGSVKTMHPPPPPSPLSSDGSTSDCVPPNSKIARLSTTNRMEMKEESEGRSGRNEASGSRPIYRSSVPEREAQKTSGIQKKKEVEVETPKPRMVRAEPKREMKEEMVESEEENERRDERDSRLSQLKRKKSRPSEELTRQAQMTRMIMKKEIKEEEEEDVITID